MVLVVHGRFRSTLAMVASIATVLKTPTMTNFGPSNEVCFKSAVLHGIAGS